MSHRNIVEYNSSIFVVVLVCLVHLNIFYELNLDSRMTINNCN